MFFNFIDLAVIFLAFVIIFRALLHGFVREVFSLVNWIVAICASQIISPYILYLFSGKLASSITVNAIIRIVIFLIFFVSFHFSTSDSVLRLRKKISKGLDRSLGILYGFVKLVLVLGISYSIYAAFYQNLIGKSIESKDYKDIEYLYSARTYSIIKLSGDAVNPLVEYIIDSMTNGTKYRGEMNSRKNSEDRINSDEGSLDSKELSKKIDEIYQGDDVAGSEKINKEDSDKKLKSDVNINDGKSKDEPGYKKNDIEKMNHLIDAVRQ